MAGKSPLQTAPFWIRMASMHVDAIASSEIPYKCAQYLLELTENDSDVTKLYVSWKKSLLGWHASDLALLESLETAHKLLAIYMAYTVQFEGGPAEGEHDEETESFLSELYDAQQASGPAKDLGTPIMELPLLDAYDALLWNLSEVVEGILSKTPLPKPELPD